VTWVYAERRIAAAPQARADWHLIGRNPSKVIVMNRIQRVRRSAGVLAGTAGQPCFRIAMVLLAVSLFAGAASAMAATSPARNAPVAPGWNAAAPATALAASRAMRSAMPRPRANAFGRYPRAFIEWKLSARPPTS
jgi:hypothetical protein